MVVYLSCREQNIINDIEWYTEDKRLTFIAATKLKKSQCNAYRLK